MWFVVGGDGVSVRSTTRGPEGGEVSTRLMETAGLPAASSDHLKQAKQSLWLKARLRISVTSSRAHTFKRLRFHLNKGYVRMGLINKANRELIRSASRDFTLFYFKLFLLSLSSVYKAYWNI